MGKTNNEVKRVVIHTVNGLVQLMDIVAVGDPDVVVLQGRDNIVYLDPNVIAAVELKFLGDVITEGRIYLRNGVRFKVIIDTENGEIKDVYFEPRV